MKYASIFLTYNVRGRRCRQRTQAQVGRSKEADHLTLRSSEGMDAVEKEKKSSNILL